MRIPRKLKKTLKYDNGWMGTLLTPDKTGLPFAIMCILKDYGMRIKSNKPRLYVFTDNNWFMDSYKQSNLELHYFHKNGTYRGNKHLDKFITLNYNILMDYWNQRGDSSILYHGIQRI